MSFFFYFGLCVRVCECPSLYLCVCACTRVCVHFTANGFNFLLSTIYVSVISGLNTPICGRNSSLTKDLVFTSRHDQVTLIFKRNRYGVKYKSKFNMTFMAFYKGINNFIKVPGTTEPRKYTTPQTRRYNVAATSRRCDNVIATFSAMLCVCWEYVFGHMPRRIINTCADH